jgi:hypothetical protein
MLAVIGRRFVEKVSMTTVKKRKLLVYALHFYRENTHQYVIQ